MLKRVAEFQPARLTQARLMREWSMAELAQQTGLTRQAISLFEKSGGKAPSAETLRALARELGVEPSFLTCPIRKSETGEALQTAITFRTLASSTKRHRDQAGVLLTWLAGVSDFLWDYVEPPQLRIPKFDIADFATLSDDDVESYAEKARRALGIGDGPISDLTLLLENHGCSVAYVTLAPGMDGISAWISGRPFILISDKAYSARARFDLAHELGHVLLHQALSQDELESKDMLRLVEDQANLFASCFLLPERTFAKGIYGTDRASLLAAKSKWGVSMQAILMRLRQIGLISERQLMRGFQQISAAGHRKKEPLDDTTKPERARLYLRIMEFVKERINLAWDDFVDGCAYPIWFISQVTGITVTPNPTQNVIPFKLRPV
jgi:Zn-dependent peptidase ImmA (M78 family)/transcriptional regulator with XRE-family HTH domain